jgi:hypothetical protein
VRFYLICVALWLAPAVVEAQADGGGAVTAAARRAARTITERDVRQRIHLLAHDSMGGRWTPSRELDLTAAYIANEFRRLGLRPGGDGGSYVQRYPIRQEVIAPEESALEFTGTEGTIRIAVAADAAILAGRGTVEGEVLLVSGIPDAAQVPVNAYRGAVLVWVGDWSRGVNQLQVQRALNRLGAALVILPINNDSVLAVMQQVAARPQTVGGTGGSAPMRIAVRESALLAQLPQAADVFAALRAAPSFTVTEAAGWRARAVVSRRVLQQDTAPNVVGILPGADPILREEYVVFSAHMDHVGRTGAGACIPAGADSLCNGADDNASGTVGVLEVAEAFAQPGVRPSRSVIFLAVSGEERGLWGSDWFATHPPVPAERMVANINADMIGRNWRDTIVVIGKEHSDLGATLARVVARHAELGLTAIDDLWPEQNFYQRSDHFNFARRGVPILFFFNGTHPDYHRPSDSPDKIDAEKLARVAQLMFWVGLEVANAPQRPQWDPESYRRYVTP